MNDELQANIWDPQHMDKIVPSLLFNLQHVEEAEVQAASVGAACTASLQPLPGAQQPYSWGWLVKPSPRPGILASVACSAAHPKLAPCTLALALLPALRNSFFFFKVCIPEGKAAMVLGSPGVSVC